MLPQHGEIGAELSVTEVVATGRTAHKGLLSREDETDRAVVASSLERVRSLGLTVVAALHDLDHAAAHADQVVVLSEGRVAGHGPPLSVLTPAFVEEVFGVRAHVGPHPLTGRPHIAVASMVGG